MAATEIVCPMCGAKNPATASRCGSCGARIEPLGDALNEEEREARRYQQQGFSWLWAAVAFGVYFMLQGFVLVALKFALDGAGYDPQGAPGILLAAIVFFVGGSVVGFVSPGKTFIEPAVAALIVMLPTVGWLMAIDDVARLSTGAYIIGGLLGVMVSLFGAFLGERVQMLTGR